MLLVTGIYQPAAGCGGERHLSGDEQRGTCPTSTSILAEEERDHFHGRIMKIFAVCLLLLSLSYLTLSTGPRQ